MTTVNDAIASLQRQLAERIKDDAHTPCVLSMERAQAVLDAMNAPEAKQEPVAWGIANTRPTESKPLMMVMLDEPPPSHLVIPLYTTPPSREWVGLTDEQIHSVRDDFGDRPVGLVEFARAIEAKLKERNHD